MLGPRSMGAGTPRYDLAGDNEPDDTLYAEEYGGIEVAHLTPAQRLIERYERLSTPPPPHTPPAERSTFRREYRKDGKDDGYSGRQYMGPDSLMTPRGAERETRSVMGMGGGPSLKKDRSPIRQSLKNLFSVLKKGAGGLTKRRSEDREPLLALGVAAAVGGGVGGGSLLRPSSENLGRGGNPNALITDTKGRSKALSAISSSSGSSSRPKKKMTGSLIYLTHSPSFSPDSGAQDSITWTPCSVTLEPESHKLLVSSFTTTSGSLPGEGMELCVHEITLMGCVDIRSLSAAQLGMAEARFLLEAGGGQEEGDKLKVFEILFKEGEGRTRERFAARSVRERAGWISAIWDAILPSQDPKDFQSGPKQKQDIANVPSGQQLSVESPIPTLIPKLSELLSPSYSDRSLPALPPKSPIPIPDTLPLSLPRVAPLVTPKKAPNLHLDLSEFKGSISPPNMYPPTSHSRGQFSLNDVVISPSIYPPTSRPVSMFVASPISPVSGISVGSGTGSTCPNSPSIRNLSRLSVVRHRLAQIERNHSELSAESRYSSSSTTPSSGPVSPAGSGWSKQEAVFRNAAIRAGTKRETKSRSSSRSGTLAMRSGHRSADGDGKRREDEDKCAPSSRQAPPPDPPDKFDDSGHEKEEHGAPKSKSKARHMSLADTPTKTTGSNSKDDIRKISSDVAGIRSVLGKEAGNRSVHQIVVGLEQRAQADKKELRVIKDTLKVLGECVAEAIETTKVKAMADVAPVPGPAPVETKPTGKDDNAIVQALNEVKNRLSTELPALAGKLQDIKDAQDKERDRVVTCANVDASSSTQASSSPGDSSKVVDPKLLLDRLEEIRILCQAPAQAATESKDEKCKEENAGLQENLTKILGLVQEDGNKQTLLAQQQADSVRYLNELNTWLEAFVNNGTSQIQGISANIDRLCNEIGASPVKPGAAGPLQPNLVNDIRQLVAGMKARDQNFAALQAAVHSLLEVLTISQTQKGADSQAIAGLMNRQRHDQEVMFKAFTNEISGEIKGERLRFVDAMKEATAINVQLHVEQFKQELSKEVMAMTEEVGRLHREKQQVENQISDLFSFYSKHKQAEMPLQTIQPNTGIPGGHTQETPRASIPRSNQLRSLPNYPRRQ